MSSKINNHEDLRDTEAYLPRDYDVLLKSYFGQMRGGHQLVRHQIESFDYFIETLIPNIIKQFNPISVYYEYQKEANKYEYEFELTFGEIALEPPTISENDGSFDEMTPAKARSRSLTYASNLRADLEVKIIHRTGEPDKLEKEETHKRKLYKVLLGKIPIMVQSKYCVLSKYPNIPRVKMGECRYDPGGYFIINGNEKVIISQERSANNSVNIFSNNKPKNRFGNSCDIKSEPECSFGSTKNLSIKIRTKDNAIRALAHRFAMDLPVWTFFIALGIESDQEIIRLIVHDLDEPANQPMINYLRASIEDFQNVNDFKNIIPRQIVALEYLSKHVSYLGAPKDIRLTTDDKIRYLRKILEDEFLPHVGRDFQKKAFFLGYMINKLLTNQLSDNEMIYDDRDDYGKKRIDSPGILLGALFSQCFKALVKDMKKAIVKELRNNKNWKTENDITEVININNISKLAKPNIIEGGLKYSLATGDWKVKSSRSQSRSGTAQVLNRLTYPSAISHLRRLNSPSEKNGKIIPPRKVHNTSWGVACPAETPEGAAVGLVKNLSNGCTITKPSPSSIIWHRLKQLNVSEITKVPPKRLFHDTKVFVNGDLYGVSDEPSILVAKLRSLRRQGLLNIYTSIYWYHLKKEIIIYSDAGRLVRPLCIVDPPNRLRLKARHIIKLKKKVISWNHLILPQINENLIYETNLDETLMKEKLNDMKDMHEGVIEYIDTLESNNLLIASKQSDLYEHDSRYNYQYTHCEIMVGLMLGVLASCIPFADHNQSPRNTYQSAQGKQAMGVYATNYNLRLDSLAHVLRYPQKPLVNTKFSQYFYGDKIASGINAIVCILTYTGYNQEDSVIISQSAIDRGFFTSVYYRSYKDDEKKIQSSGQEEKFANPDQLDEITGEKKYDITIGKKRSDSYLNLDERGFVKENIYVSPGQIIIGKIIPIRQQDRSNTKVSYRDISTPLRTNEEGYVSRVYESRNSEGFRFCKVKIRSIRVPVIGDKFCLPGDTIVYTENGAISIKEYYDTNIDLEASLRGRVMSYYPETESFSYDHPTELIYFPEATTLIQFRTIVNDKEFILRTTPEHKVYAKKHPKDTFQLIEAKQLLSQNCIMFYGANNLRGNVKTYLGNNMVNSFPLTILFGIWAKYGNLSDKPNVLVFNFTQTNQANCDDAYVYCKEITRISNSTKSFNKKQILDLAEEYRKDPIWDLENKYPDVLRGIKRVLLALGINADETMFFGDREIELHSEELYNLFQEVEQNDNGEIKLPAWIYDLDSKCSEVLEKLERGLLTSDLADGLIASDAFNGLEVLRNIHLDQRFIFQTDEYQEISIKGSNIIEIQYNKPVYCLTVPSHIMMVCDHYSGVPVWTGNSSRHGQKGTCGMVYSDENMPRTKDGIVPSIIVNPHAIPSRMTVGHLIECITGKVAADLGSIGDATPFTDLKPSDIANALEKQGFNRHGDEVLYTRIDGRQIKSLVFTGPTYYQRLKHMVDDKIHSRPTGPVVMLTRQCSEGRSRDGGLRVGEMERDAILSHGASVFLKERLMDMSDNYRVYICDLCGVIANYNMSTDPRTEIEYKIQECKQCQNNSAFSEIRIPYSCKLLIQELYAMGIIIRLIPE